MTSRGAITVGIFREPTATESVSEAPLARLEASTMQRAHDPLFDVHPVTGARIEIFYADRTLESFGRIEAGWYWWPRRRGFAPDGPAVGPFATSYRALRDALHPTALAPVFGDRVAIRLQRALSGDD